MPLEDRARWDERYRDPKRELFDRPRQLLIDHLYLLPQKGIALELAMGLGQNTQTLLKHGLKVIGIDISPVAVRLAKRSNPDLMAIIADLNHFYIPSNHFDLILNFYYLQRDLWGEYFRALKPGGLLFFETLTQDIRKVREDISPHYLLYPNELRSALSNWQILFYREGWINSSHERKKAVASIVARKPT